MIFYQLFEHESSTYTYLLMDAASREAVLIDPVIETIDRDLKLVEEVGAKLKYILDTHVHADHITSAGQIRSRTGIKTVLGQKSGVSCADILVKDGDELQFGSHTIQVYETPGHTNGCVTYRVGDKLFTGDALLIRGNGRTDFQEGSAETLYDSIHKLFALGDDLTIYPAHDYKGQTKSLIALEKRFNPRIGGGKSKSEFVKIMKELKLANPKKIMEAVPANMACGFMQDARTIAVDHTAGIPETTVEQLQSKLKNLRGKVRLIDVRRPDEFTGELGHIEGSELVTLGPDLDQFLKKADHSEEIIFICRSGNRSGHATRQFMEEGFKFVANMRGGMLKWNEAGFPTKK